MALERKNGAGGRLAAARLLVLISHGQLTELELKASAASPCNQRGVSRKMPKKILFL